MARRRAETYGYNGRFCFNGLINKLAAKIEGEDSGKGLYIVRHRSTRSESLADGARLQRPAELDALRGRKQNKPSDQVGCVRDFTLKDGGRIRERLLAFSDHEMSCTYSILESPMGVENYVATLSLTPVTDGNQTFAQWTAEFDAAPEREADLVRHIGQNVFQGAFNSLKERLTK